MIVTGVLHVVAQILSYAMMLLPQVGGTLDKFVSSSESFFAYAYLLNGYFPIATLGLCITILWGAHSLDFVGNFILKVYDKLPGKMT